MNKNAILPKNIHNGVFEYRIIHKITDFFHHCLPSFEHILSLKRSKCLLSLYVTVLYRIIILFISGAINGNLLNLEKWNRHQRKRPANIKWDISAESRIFLKVICGI